MPTATDSPPRPISDEQLPSKPPDLSLKLPKLTPRRKSKSEQRAFSPAPSTPNLPPLSKTYDFHHPTRRILSPKDHQLFLESQTYTLITSFVFTVTDSIRALPISSVSQKTNHKSVDALLSILSQISSLQQAHPPDHTNGSRFGNPTFRTFLSALSPKLTPWHEQHFPSLSSNALDELHTYLHNSFGSSLRIDYGSGHELNFFMYLLCLNRLGFLPESTFPALALIVFPQYITLMRTIQDSYYLEPAGSHGVWGLDDYHFLPFLFGASQLANPERHQSQDTAEANPRKGGAAQGIMPLSIHSDAVLETYASDYLYLDMVQHVNATKTVQGLRWHSPMLDDISGVKTKDGGWTKIEGGMRKMFVREVLGKLVVMQHFLFGGIIPAVEGMSIEGDEMVRVEDEEGAMVNVEEGEARRAPGHEGHAHNANSWGDCCGIKVPSSVGAVGEMRKRNGAEGLRRLPFD